MIMQCVCLFSALFFHFLNLVFGVHSLLITMEILSVVAAFFPMLYFLFFVWKR